MTSAQNALKPALITIIFLILIGVLVYWLWQRQPNGNNYQTSQTATSPSNKLESKIHENDFIIAPEGNIIVTEDSVTFAGKTNPNNFVLAFSNYSQNISQADNNGGFEIKLNLVEGLNQINFISLNKEFNEDHTKTTVLYFDSESTLETVYSGPVKSIFDSLITIETSDGDQTIRKKTSTDLFFQETVDDEDTDIRVGDFLTALGTIENEKDFDAKIIEVFRQNKPQNNEQYLFGVLTSEVETNIFSMRNQKNANLVEFLLDSETGILIEGKNADEDKIVKNKSALIIFHEDSENNNAVDLIYLLP